MRTRRRRLDEPGEQYEIGWKTHLVTQLAVPVSAGAFATSALNALDHENKRACAPRFGAVVRLTGPNQLDTDWAVDGFGRKTFERRGDSTGTAIYHLWLSASFNGVASTASNSAGCHN